METVKHALHSAESALHKDAKVKSGQEPMSGVRGQGTATDPYDAGNVSSELPLFLSNYLLQLLTFL